MSFPSPSSKEVAREEREEVLSASGWGNFGQLKPGAWRCGVCRSTNPKEACTTCLSCKNDKPGYDNGTGELTMTQSEPSINAGAGAVGAGAFTVRGVSLSSGLDACPPRQQRPPRKGSASSSSLSFFGNDSIPASNK